MINPKIWDVDCIDAKTQSPIKNAYGRLVPKRGRSTKTPSPQVADPGSRKVSRTIDTSVLGALLQEGPATHPLLMLFHLLLSQTSVTTCQPPGRRHGQGEQLRQIWPCAMKKEIGQQTWTPQRKLTQWPFLLPGPWGKARGQFRPAVFPRIWYTDRGCNSCNPAENLNHRDYRDKIATHTSKTNTTKDDKCNMMDEPTPKQTNSKQSRN